MIVTHTIADCREQRATLGRLALVPTMGALHAGHLSLVSEARRQADHVAVSIFVNPTQFGPNEDYHRYPKPIEADLAMCEAAGVDLVFCPTADEMYPADVPTASIDLADLTATLEGAHRPGHFAGVCQVVAKLFNILHPQAACFGEKDFQQLAVLTAMTTALNFPLTIIPCPTLREPDGLAMSSRNRYLSPAERRRALSISRALVEAAAQVRAGVVQAAALREAIVARLDDSADAPGIPVKLDYATIVDRATLREVGTIERPSQAVVAMRVGTTRLIDNIRHS